MAGLAAGLGLLLWPSTREWLAGWAERAGARLRLAGLDWLWLPGLFCLFWWLRERQLYGDSNVLMLMAARGAWFLVPDPGATFLFRLAHVSAQLLGLEALAVTQLFVCLAGTTAVGCFAGLGAQLPQSRPHAMAALVLCGGVARTFFGHVEVYAFVVAAAGAYLWAAAAFLSGRGSWWRPALALGCGLLLHFSFAFLLPSLLVLYALAGARERWLRRSAAGLLLAALPGALFLLALLLAGREEDLLRAWSALREISGASADESRWLRWPWQPPGPGTDFPMLSTRHGKYLLNAAFVLAPAGLLLWLGQLLRRPRSLVERPLAAFLASASLGTLLYALLLRPMWGPYDWDLFSLGAVCLASWAACAFLTGADEDRSRGLVTLAVGASLLLVTLPFVAIGMGLGRPAGPFAETFERRADETIRQTLERAIEPWL